MRSLLLSCVGFALVVASLAGACSPSPTDDALGWNGRGLPVLTGSAGGPGGDGAGSGPAGAGMSTGTAGTASETGAAGTGAGGVSPTGGAGSGGPQTGAAGGGGASMGAGGTSSAGAAGTSGGAGSAPPTGAAGAPPSGGPPAGTTCHLDVVVTTHSGGGNHAPKNVDAIWIQDGAGKFVKSLYVMARNEIQHLNAWNTATTAAGLSRNRVDAVTGASLSGYGTRMASWNCTDVNQKLVALGGYQVCFDLNDGNGTDKHTCDNITFGKTATTLMPPDALPCFTGRVLTYTP